MAIADAEVRAWLQANPNAAAKEIGAAMVANGVDLSQLSRVSGRSQADLYSSAQAGGVDAFTLSMVTHGSSPVVSAAQASITAAAQAIGGAVGAVMTGGAPAAASAQSYKSPTYTSPPVYAPPVVDYGAAIQQAYQQEFANAQAMYAKQAQSQAEARAQATARAQAEAQAQAAADAQAAARIRATAQAQADAQAQAEADARAATQRAADGAALARGLDDALTKARADAKAAADKSRLADTKLPLLVPPPVIDSAGLVGGTANAVPLVGVAHPVSGAPAATGGISAGMLIAVAVGLFFLVRG